MPQASPLYLVDAFNLLHAVILKGSDRKRWWAPERQQQVLNYLADIPCGETIAVFDAKPSSAEHAQRPDRTAPLVTPQHVRVLRAANADDAIVALVEEESPHRRVAVVTADRQLADRATARGAERLSPWEFARLASSVA